MTDPVLLATVDDTLLEELVVEALDFYGVEYEIRAEKQKGLFDFVTVTAFYVDSRDLSAALDAYDAACCDYIDEMDEEDDWDDMF